MMCLPGLSTEMSLVFPFCPSLEESKTCPHYNGDGEERFSCRREEYRQFLEFFCNDDLFLLSHFFYSVTYQHGLIDNYLILLVPMQYIFLCCYFSCSGFSHWELFVFWTCPIPPPPKYFLTFWHYKMFLAHLTFSLHQY